MALFVSPKDIKVESVSVVIPVKDNQKGIDQYLDVFFSHIGIVNYPKEIIIVDNNSNPAITLSEQYIDSGIVKLIQCSKKGPAAARNLGVMHSTGDWILFNDSDCIPTDCFLSGYLDNSNGAVGYAGNIKAASKTILSKYYDNQETLLPLKSKGSDGITTPSYLVTANAMVWKQAFLAINGFNEAIDIAAGEDIDLGYRLLKIGRLDYAFDSIVLHDFSDGFIGFYKRFKRYGTGNRFIEMLWKIDMMPLPFKPNKKNAINWVLVFLQYLFLLNGYFNIPKNKISSILHNTNSLLVTP